MAEDNPQEAARRAEQRQVQELATKLQKSGKTGKDLKKALREFKQQLRSSNSKKKRAKTWREGLNREKKSRRIQQSQDDSISIEAKELGRKHNIVIIPIFWKKKEEEMAKVIAAAQDLKSKLIKYKLNVWIDQRSSLSPGQKFNYWEQVGVKLRAEIGPDEALRGTIVLSKLTKPGEVAKRWKGLEVKSREGMTKLIEKVKAEGEFSWLETDVAFDECDSEGKKETLPNDVDTDDVVHQTSSVINTTTKNAAGKSIEESGDSLEVNYIIE